MIREKVKMLHADLMKDSPGMSAESDSFKASGGSSINLGKEVVFIV